MDEAKEGGSMSELFFQRYENKEAIVDEEARARAEADYEDHTIGIVPEYTTYLKEVQDDR